jgi:hypothetical protein
LHAGAPRRYVPRRVPVFIAPLVGFALGVLLAWFSAAAPHRPSAMRAGGSRTTPPAPRRRPLALVSLFAGFVFTPVCAYFLLFMPDWSFAYLIDADRIPSAVDLLLLFLDAGSVPAGFIAARGDASPVVGGRFPALRSMRTVAALAGVPLAVALLALLALSRSLTLDGTYRQVQGNFGVRAVVGGPLGYALLWMHTMLIAGVVVTVRALLGRDMTAPRGADPRRAGRPAPSSGEPPRSTDAPMAAAPHPSRRLGMGRSSAVGRPGPGR